MYKGNVVPVWHRRDLALALHREQGTIRAMEQQGVLVHPRLMNSRGWWCYTRDQIEDLVQLAKEEGVLDPSLRKPFSNRFIKEAKRILKRMPTEGSSY